MDGFALARSGARRRGADADLDVDRARRGGRPRRRTQLRRRRLSRQAVRRRGTHRSDLGHFASGRSSVAGHGASRVVTRRPTARTVSYGEKPFHLGATEFRLMEIPGAQCRHRAFAGANRRTYLGLRLRRLEQHRRRLREPASPKAQSARCRRFDRNRVGRRIPLTGVTVRAAALYLAIFACRFARPEYRRLRIHGAGIRIAARPALNTPEGSSAWATAMRRVVAHDSLLDVPLIAIVAAASYALARLTIAPL